MNKILIFQMVLKRLPYCTNLKSVQASEDNSDYLNSSYMLAANGFRFLFKFVFLILGVNITYSQGHMYCAILYLKKCHLCMEMYIKKTGVFLK